MIVVYRIVSFFKAIHFILTYLLVSVFHDPLCMLPHKTSELQICYHCPHSLRTSTWHTGHTRCHSTRRPQSHDTDRCRDPKNRNLVTKAKKCQLKSTFKKKDKHSHQSKGFMIWKEIQRNKTDSAWFDGTGNFLHQWESTMESFKTWKRRI